MEKITLKPVAVFDLNARFAREMGDKKVRHYIVPASIALIKKFTGMTVEDVVSDYIKRTEGLDVEFDDSMGENPSFDLIDELPPTFTKTVGGLEVTDVSSIVLGKDRNIFKALAKNKAYSLIHQTNYYPTFFHRMRDRLAYRYNESVVPRVNRFLRFLYGVRQEEYNPFVKQIPYLNYIYIRDMNLTHYLSVAFEADDALSAMESLREDLRTLHKNKLIIGHLAMPSIMKLADTVGAGRYYVFFCFPIIGYREFLKATGKTPLELPQFGQQLKLVGVKNEGAEGEVRWFNGRSPDKIYTIENVYIRDLDVEESHQKVVDSYNDSRPAIEAAAKKTRENLANWEKIESRTVSGHNSVDVDVTLRNKKTGDVQKVDSEFREKHGGIRVRREDQ